MMDPHKEARLRSRPVVARLFFRRGQWYGQIHNMYFRDETLEEAADRAHEYVASRLVQYYGYDDRMYSPWLKKYLNRNIPQI